MFKLTNSYSEKNKKPFFQFDDIQTFQQTTQVKKAEKNLNSDLYGDECDEGVDMQPEEKFNR